MFALLWKTRTVLRSISNNLKEHHHQTKDKAENSNGFRDLSRAFFFLCFLIIMSFLACKVGDQNL